MSYRLGVDVGGTFTDLSIYDDTTGILNIYKTPSTPENQSKAVKQGVLSLINNLKILVNTWALAKLLRLLNVWRKVHLY